MADPYAPTEGERRMAWMDRSAGGVWWLVAAAGVGVLVLASTIAFFDGSRHSAAEVFSLLGFLGLETGLTLSALLGAGWPWGARVALMVGAAFFALRAVGGVTVLF